MQLYSIPLESITGQKRKWTKANEQLIQESIVIIAKDLIVVSAA